MKEKEIQDFLNRGFSREAAYRMAREDEIARRENTGKDVETILAERQAIYGDYSEVAQTSQSIKMVLRSGASWRLMTDRERESLDMIANKLARIVNGLPHRDNWVDLAGYSELIAKMMKE